MLYNQYLALFILFMMFIYLVIFRIHFWCSFHFTFLIPSRTKYFSFLSRINTCNLTVCYLVELLILNDEINIEVGSDL